ncbi:MAG: hypothetical protein ACRYF5_00910 [Janthinobacterium lividum]
MAGANRTKPGVWPAAIMGTLLALSCLGAHAQSPCRIGYDMGSSGIRASMTGSDQQPRADIDYLAPLLAGRRLDETAVPTIDALRSLPAKAGFGAECLRVAAGFSAWRLALQRDRPSLVNLLARLHAQTGVSVLVMPQTAEGSYAYRSAMQQLGTRLHSSHVLDIGGGSLQVAGQRTTYGEALGQKTWDHALCLALAGTTGQPCALQPMSAARLARARDLLAQRLAGIPAALPEPVSMTAISRPVTQGVAPAVARLNGDPPGQALLRLADLSLAIGKLAALELPQAARRLALDERYAAYLLSDMLLVEGIMKATGNSYLLVAQADLSNAQGLLSDDQAYGWVGRYACYLQRLSADGLAAYSSDAASCAAGN